MLDCVEESVGGSVRRVGKAVGDLLENLWYLKGLGKRRKSVGIYPLNGKVLVAFSCEVTSLLC